jgi:type II secretory ATPase GspE/PulE/Tfp pilus assembly ATPase PilB-like protein
VANILAAPDGVVLLTGPTGSGKTTTLYSFLAEVKTPEIKVITTEDPVEYNIEGVTQVQVNDTVGLDFGLALRAILRHDPDIVLVGEIRDRETADIAVRAAMTGHKVFSTLHTNDAPSAMTRLIDLGIDPFLITSSIHAVIAQRLVRKLCLRCKKATALTTSEQQLLDDGVTKTAFSPVGCRLCGNTGYYGRLPIFEILLCDEAVRAAVLKGESSEQLRTIALNSGMKSLFADGLDKVRRGLTTLHDIANVVG